MPTAPKLIGAVLLFGVGWLAALFAIETLPEGTPARYFPLAVALIGFWQGWRVIGGMAGQGLGAAVAHGLRASVQTAVIALAVFSLREMFLRSLTLRYRGAGEATTATLDLFLEFALQSLTIPIWGVLILGGCVAGAITEWSARHWR